ncbi:MAG TPA: ABC transporter ATP-binding protein, partial [Chloroflexota bacterium]|nr:ABC transporter ATP-binding protein [Chloroflexota bacterium]
MNIPLRSYLELLAKYLRPQRHKAGWLALLMLAQIGLQLLNPQLLRRFIDDALAGASMDSLVGLALAFIAITLLTQALLVAATYVSQDVGWTATNALRVDLAEHCLGLDMPFHKARTPGELIERIDGDVSALANFFSQFTVMVLSNMLLLAGVLVVLWLEDWRIGAPLSLFTLMALFVLNRTRSFATPYQIRNRQAHAMMFGFLEERLAGIEDIRANGAGPYAVRRFAELSRDVYRKATTAELAFFATEVASISFFNLAFIGSLALGFVLFQSGALTVGAIFLLVRYTQMLQQPMQQLTRQLQDMQKASAGIVRIRELLKLRPQVLDGQAGLAHDGALTVQFEHVSFEYDDASAARNGDSASGAVLHDLSFTLPAGTLLGLLGRTGSGKTTITRLLARLYDPTSGAIRLDGKNIRAVRLADLRSTIAMVTQDVQLFRASLRDNLTLFDSRIGDGAILGALDELGLRAWCEALPDGLDTQLASGGSLSAGEAQLLAFTRALLRDPALVILDEASSRLDPATERLIERAVDKLLRGRTGIIIAHRLATVQRADEILILD